MIVNDVIFQTFTSVRIFKQGYIFKIICSKPKITKIPIEPFYQQTELELVFPAVNLYFVSMENGLLQLAFYLQKLRVLSIINIDTGNADASNIYTELQSMATMNQCVMPRTI